MPIRPRPTRLPAKTASSRPPRSWTRLPESTRTQLAQQIAQLLRRLWDAGETRHADRK